MKIEGRFEMKRVEEGCSLADGMLLDIEADKKQSQQILDFDLDDLLMSCCLVVLLSCCLVVLLSCCVLSFVFFPLFLSLFFGLV